MKVLFLLFSILCFSNSQANTITRIHWDEDTIVSKKKDTVADSKLPNVVLYVDQQAKFKYGNDSLRNFIYDNVQYPENAREHGISGEVIVLFIVEIDGSISNVNIERSSGNTELNEEAKRLVKLLSGKFNPAMKNGQPVRAYARLPIVFELDE
jgi:TonB family protein